MPFQLIYASTATRPMNEHDLSEVLRQSRERNTAMGITGMLLYRDGAFLQVLEGEKAAVQKLYAAICADDRHRAVVQLAGKTVEARSFSDWTMAFRNLDDADASDLPDGFAPFLNGDASADYFDEEIPAHSKNLMLSFREAMVQ